MGFAILVILVFCFILTFEFTIGNGGNKENICDRYVKPDKTSRFSIKVKKAVSTGKSFFSSTKERMKNAMVRKDKSLNSEKEKTSCTMGRFKDGLGKKEHKEYVYLVEGTLMCGNEPAEETTVVLVSRRRTKFIKNHEMGKAIDAGHTKVTESIKNDQIENHEMGKAVEADHTKMTESVPIDGIEKPVIDDPSSESVPEASTSTDDESEEDTFFDAEAVLVEQALDVGGSFCIRGEAWLTSKFRPYLHIYTKCGKKASDKYRRIKIKLPVDMANTGKPFSLGICHLEKPFLKEDTSRRNI